MSARLLTPVVLFTALASGALALGVATPASAADTPVEFTVIAGALAISAPGAVAFGAVTDSVEGAVLSQSLGLVTVTDARGGTGRSWTATAVSSAYTSLGSPDLAAAGATYASGSITSVKAGGVTAPGVFTSGGLVNIGTSRSVVSATGITANEASSWSPAVAVAVPAGTASGVYAGFVTHSVA